MVSSVGDLKPIFVFLAFSALSITPGARREGRRTHGVTAKKPPVEAPAPSDKVGRSGLFMLRA
jgi:hypothetical protein